MSPSRDSLRIGIRIKKGSRNKLLDLAAAFAFDMDLVGWALDINYWVKKLQRLEFIRSAESRYVLQHILVQTHTAAGGLDRGDGICCCCSDHLTHACDWWTMLTPWVG